MPILIFEPPEYNFFSLMVLAGMLVVIFGGAYLFVLFKKYVIHGKHYKAQRAETETICGWEYSADEWRKYAKEYEPGKHPKGAAIVRITPLDLWFTDDADALRKPIDSSILMVTDCRYANNFLKIRIRSGDHSGESSHYHSHDYLIPVPPDKAHEAQKAVEYFKNNIARNTAKLSSVTPPETITGLFGETNF